MSGKERRNQLIELTSICQNTGPGHWQVDAGQGLPPNIVSTEEKRSNHTIT
jgi:hypothetical protein